VQPVGVAPLAPHPQPLVLQVQVADVGGQDFLGAGGRLIEQPPQALLPDADVGAPEQPLERRLGDALVRSSGSLRRSSTAAGSSAVHPRRRAWAVKERRVATWRFQVAGAHVVHAALTKLSRVALSRAASDSSPWVRASRVRVWA